MIHNTQGTQNEKALHLFLEHFSCFQLANGKDKNKQKTQQTNTMHQKKNQKTNPQQNKHLLNDSPCHGTIT